MGVFQALLEVIFPVVFITIVGTALGRTLKIEQGSISKLVLFALAPSLAFDNLSKSTVQASVALSIVGAYICFEAIMGLIAWFSSTDVQPSTRRAMVASVITGNNGNFGLPISLFAFGKTGLELSLVIFTISVFFTFLIGPAILSESQDWRSRLMAAFKLPLFWAASAGMLVNVLHIPVPIGLERGIHLIGQAAIPILLLSLGLQIGQQGLPKLEGPIVRSSGLRLILGPFVAFAFGKLFALTGLELAVLVLSAAMPTAVNAFLLASELNADSKTVAGTVVVTTVASLPVIALVVTLFR
jgi:malate permease and related proteins